VHQGGGRAGRSSIVGDALRQQWISAVLIAGCALGALLLAGRGMVVGIPTVYFAGILLRSLLVGSVPHGSRDALHRAAGLGVVALIACYVPARRLLGKDPAQSLREKPGRRLRQRATRD
jgi:hypothetical protein